MYLWQTRGCLLSYLDWLYNLEYNKKPINSLEELLKQAIPYARKVFNDEYTSIVVNTNLTIYDEELFEIYKANDIEVQVSIDGKKEQHDLHRKKRDGTGSFEIVLPSDQAPGNARPAAQIRFL